VIEVDLEGVALWRGRLGWCGGRRGIVGADGKRKSTGKSACATYRKKRRQGCLRYKMKTPRRLARRSTERSNRTREYLDDQMKFEERMGGNGDFTQRSRRARRAQRTRRRGTGPDIVG
jgi:hypothetical protein